MPGLFAVLAGWAGGLLADRAIRGGASVSRVRKTVIAGGLAGGSVLMFAALVPEAWMAVVLLSVPYGSLTIAGTGSRCVGKAGLRSRGPTAIIVGMSDGKGVSALAR